MKIENFSLLSVSLMFLLSLFIVKDCGAGSQDEKGEQVTTVCNKGYEKRLLFEKKLLEGLIKLLDLKQREILPDKRMTSELISKNGNLTVKREISDSGINLYTINARFVPLNDILQALASYSGRKIIIDEDIGEETMSSVVSVSLEYTPFADIIEILIGSKGLESVMSDDIVFVTVPAKLDLISSYDYYQEKAVQVYQMAMIKYPQYKNIANAYYELGEFYLASGLPAIALQEFRIVVEKYQGCPKGNVSMYNIGKCYEMLGDTENAIQSYLQYTKKYPRDDHVVDAFLKAADLWRKQKNYQKAIEILKFVITEYPEKNTASVAELRLGYTYFDMEDYVSALDTFSGMKERDQFTEFQNEIEYQIGLCYYLMGEYSEAVGVFNNFVMYKEGNDLLDDAYYKLADCFFMMEEYLVAFKLYKGALSEFNESSLTPYGLLYSGKSLRMLNMFGMAEKILREGLSSYPDSVYAGSMNFEIGLCYYEDENFKRAFDVFEGIARDERNRDLTAQANMYAGICLSGEKQYRRALEFYRKAIDEDGSLHENDKVFGLVGDCYTELGELANAVRAYQKEFP